MLEISHALKEWEQFPFVSYCNTQIPSRTIAARDGGQSPAPKMIESINKLAEFGATSVAVPCNSAHGWYQEVTAETKIPWINLIEETSKIAKLYGDDFLVLSAYTPRKMRLYERYLDNVHYPSEKQQESVYKAIELIKANELERAKRVLNIDMRKEDCVILACTELPIIIDWWDNVVDSTFVYAKRCVEEGEKWFTK